MILDENTMNTKTNCNLPSKAFSIKKSPIAFDILSNKLYSNPTLAIVRELFTNAYDSHKAANTLDTPIHVHIPDRLETNFIIRDYGTGLSKEDVLTIYTTFFESTKSTSNDFTGCFGLGSKTPFSYTSTFTVNSYFNGIKYSFIATKKDGYPSIILTNEIKTKELNGLEINIPIQENDVDSFSFYIKNYLKWIPEIITDTDIKKAKSDFTIDNIKFISSHREDLWFLTGHSTKVTDYINIKQGQNIFNVYLLNNCKNELYLVPYFRELNKRYAIIVEVPIGTFDITPSRETLTVNAHNIETLKKTITDIETKLKDFFHTNLTEKIHTLPSIIKAQLLNIKYYSKINGGYYETIACTLYAATDEFINCSLAFKQFILTRVNLDTFEPSIRGLISSKNNKTLIIFAPEKSYKYSTENICNRIRVNFTNAPYDSYYILSIPKVKFNDVTNVFEFKNNQRAKLCLKIFYKIIHDLNNISELNFDITIMGCSKFFRKYTNKYKIKQDQVNSNNIRCKRIVFDTQDIYGWYAQERGRNYKTIKRIKEIYSDLSNTVIITDFSNVNLWTDIFVYLANICNNKGENILIEYIKEQAKKQGKLWKQTFNHFNILIVGKVYAKQFKKYITLDSIKDITNFIRNTDFHYHDSSLDKVTLLTAYQFEKIFLPLFKKRADNIRRTNTYKILMTLRKLVIKHPYLINTYSKVELSYIIKLLNTLNIKHKKGIELKQSLIPNKIYELCNTIWYQQKHMGGHIVLDKEGYSKALELLLH